MGPALVTSGEGLRFIRAFAPVEGVFFAIPEEWVGQGECRVHSKGLGMGVCSFPKVVMNQRRQ